MFLTIKLARRNVVDEDFVRQIEGASGLWLSPYVFLPLAEVKVQDGLSVPGDEWIKSTPEHGSFFRSHELNPRDRRSDRWLWWDIDSVETTCSGSV